MPDSCRSVNFARLLRSTDHLCSVCPSSECNGVVRIHTGHSNTQTNKQKASWSCFLPGAELCGFSTVAYTITSVKSKQKILRPLLPFFLHCFSCSIWIRVRIVSLTCKQSCSIHSVKILSKRTQVPWFNVSKQTSEVHAILPSAMLPFAHTGERVTLEEFTCEELWRQQTKDFHGFSYSGRRLQALWNSSASQFSPLSNYLLLDQPSK